MSSGEAMARWLSQLSATELTELLERRGLPRAAQYRGPARNLRQLADHLLDDDSVDAGLLEATVPELQLLTAIALLAERQHGPLPEPPPRYGFTARPADLPDPAVRAVGRGELLDLLGLAPGGAEREAAERTLDRLAAQALVLPPHGDRLVVPHLLHVQATELAGYGRPVDLLLTRAFQSAEIQRIHRALLLPTARTREERQRAVVARLSDPKYLRELVGQAPPEATDLLAKLLAGPPLMRTHRFRSRYGDITTYYSGEPEKYVFRAEGSGDPGTDWLAERGLVIPVGPDLVELPYEVGSALREPDARPPYTPRPPEPSTAPRPMPAEATAREAQAAASAALGRLELLLRAVDAEPPAVRKSGGIAVRDTRRIAKSCGLAEDEARLWLDLARTAGLLAVRYEEPEPVRRGRGARRGSPSRPSGVVLPTPHYDDWLAASPADRLLPLLAAWAVVPETFSYWPAEAEQQPYAFAEPGHPPAVPVRRGLLEALAALPTGQAAEYDAGWLTVSAVWFQPMAMAVCGGDPDPDQLAATWSEAERLGLLAHGALTTLGRGVLGLLRAGAARYYPAVPGATVGQAGGKAGQTAKAGQAAKAAKAAKAGDHGRNRDGGLSARPALAEAVQRLRTALAGLLPTPRTTARFQADLTAVVTGAPAPELSALLTSCAERESEGHAVVWRISASSLRRALDAGDEADELIERLAAVSEDGRPLPQPLTYLVRDTARTHGRMRVVRSACCVRSDDEALVLELSKTRALGGIGLRRIAPTVLISTADPDTTLEALRKAGHSPVLEAETGTTVLQRAQRRRAPAENRSLDDASRGAGRNASSARSLAAELLSASGAASPSP